MKNYTILSTILLVGHATAALAQCELSGAAVTSPMPQEKLALRGALYQELCKRSEGALLDGDDTELRSKLKLAPDRGVPQFTTTEDMHWRIQKAKAPVILAYIVEEKGNVSWVAVLESSGDKVLDQAAMKIHGSTRIGTITLDGKPVRVFFTMKMFGPAQP